MNRRQKRAASARWFFESNEGRLEVFNESGDPRTFLLLVSQKLPESMVEGTLVLTVVERG